VLIGGCIGLFFLPYLLPTSTTTSLGAYAALSAVPVVLAAVLKRRLGNAVATGSILLGLALFNTAKDGLPWPAHEFIAWLSGGIGIFIFGLAIGQFSHMRQHIILANEQLARTNAQLRESHDSLRDAHQELTMMEEEVRANNVALTEANGLLAELASKDALTRVLNHRVTIEVLDHACAQAVREGRSCAVLFFDLDHFKAVNDGYGHPVGDAILVELAQIVQQNVRAGDALGRWGAKSSSPFCPTPPVPRHWRSPSVCVRRWPPISLREGEAFA